MALYIGDIQKNYETGAYRAAKPEGPDKKLPDNYVFDEELSVRKNREMVAEHNKKVDELRNAHMRQQALLDKKLTDDVVDYIMDTYELSKYQAHLVERFVYREKHSFMHDYFAYIDTFAEFADELINKCE